MADARCVAERSRNLATGFEVNQLTKAIVIAGMPVSGGAVFPMLCSDNITLRRVEVGIGEPLFVTVLLIEFTHCRSP